MASDTVPAAVPGPGDPSGTTPDTTPPGGLTGLLAPITPARNDADTFTLTPTTGPDTIDPAAVHDPSLADGSSSDFHQDPDNGQGGNGKSSTSQQGIVRAWMLALAKRHEQAGAARLKALDIKKARATALQVKENRTTNRSEKIVGGNTASGTNTQSKADKSSGSKTSTNAGRSDHKNHHTKTSAPSGRGAAGSGAGRGGGAGGSGKNGAAGHGTHNGRGTGTSGSGSGRGGGKNDTGKGHGSGTGSKSSGTGKDGSAGRPGGSGTAGKDGKTTSGSGSTGKGSGSGKDTKPKTSSTTCGTGSGIDMTKKPKDQPAKPAKDTPGGAGGTGAGGAAGKPGAPGPGKTPTPGGGAKPADLTKKTPDIKGGTTKTDPKTATGPGKPDLAKTPPGPARTSIDTKASREAGYRDGTRIGKVEAHMGAWRDGVKDGRADIKQAAARDKARLDQARQTRQHQTIPPKPTQPPAVPPRPKDQPMTQPSSADYHPQDAGPQPVQVKNVNASHIELGDGAARQYVSRGEVRTLRGLQKRLDDKTDKMTRVAEATRTLEQHATDQAREVTSLRELAKGVKGGEKLLTALAKLEEAATTQASKASQIYRRAVRGSEACRVLNSNTDTRYGGIYKAVVDSPETTPAEMRYYREMAHA